MAYLWQRDYVSSPAKQQEAANRGIGLFDLFKLDNGLATEQNGTLENIDESELLIISAGPSFEYSRRISEGRLNRVITNVEFETEYEGSHHETAQLGIQFGGSGVALEFSVGSTAGIQTEQGLFGEYETGDQAEQEIGFVLQDNDVGDNIAVHVYKDPTYGTPLFFQDPGSITSDPWESGTNPAVAVRLELPQSPANTIPFDYHAGAHYKLKLTYDGVRDLESDFSTIDFLLYAPPVDNTGQLTVQFNGQPGPYPVGLTAEAPVADIALSLYPSENDRGNPDETTYSVNIQAQQEKDAQISKLLALTPTFADLRAPRAIVTAPYDGQRVSPMVFDANNPFDIEAFSEDTDLTKIQIRSKKTDGVWGPWENLSGMVWEDGGSNNNATVFDRLDRDPIRREFTFNWPVDRGVGEYQIRAQASDNALRAGQPDFPGNVDLDPPVVNLIVDASAPTVLTTIPDYQAPESDRTYRGELSAIFTDDMQADSIGSDSFVVTDLLKNSEKVPGFISYSPALRKTLFVLVVPFKPNGFYRVEVRTDTQVDDGQGGTTTLPGARDLAGNVLDNTFSWTFRTTDGAFEETWSIELSVTDSSVGGSVGADTNNIAAVAFGAADGEEEKDARAAPSIGGQLHLSFLDVDAVEFDRDTRPADGRLSHHWFFVVDNAQGTVTLRWKPSARLVQDPSLRQYKVVKLFEFVDSGGTLTPQEIAIPDPNTARDPSTQLPAEVDLYTYIPNTGETSRYFRIDVQKASFIATDFQKGTSGWKFFSVPIDPDEAEPFVGLGDDIDPFQLYQYDTALQGYKIYPLDLGEVGLVTGRGYFTRLNQDVEIDIGGTNNAADMPVSLDTIGWHAIGNPFLLPVQVSTLEVSDGNSTNSFSDAVTAGWIQGTLY